MDERTLRRERDNREFALLVGPERIPRDYGELGRLLCSGSGRGSRSLRKPPSGGRILGTIRYNPATGEITYVENKSPDKS